MNQQLRLQVGDVVQLHSGGPRMTIQKLGDRPHEPVECCWMYEGEKKWGLFHVFTLVKKSTR